MLSSGSYRMECKPYTLVNVLGLHHYITYLWQNTVQNCAYTPILCLNVTSLSMISFSADILQQTSQISIHKTPHLAFRAAMNYWQTDKHIITFVPGKAFCSGMHISSANKVLEYWKSIPWLDQDWKFRVWTAELERKCIIVQYTATRSRLHQYKKARTTWKQKK